MKLKPVCVWKILHNDNINVLIFTESQIFKWLMKKKSGFLIKWQRSEFQLLHTFACKFFQLIRAQHVFRIFSQSLIQKKKLWSFCDCSPGAMFIPTKSCKYRQSARSVQPPHFIGQYTSQCHLAVKVTWHIKGPQLNHPCLFTRHYVSQVRQDMRAAIITSLLSPIIR